MNFIEKLKKAAEKNNSLLCVGLDMDFQKIPQSYQESDTPLLDYGKMIVDETRDFVCSYKPNSAFFESMGYFGMEQLEKLIEYIPSHIPVILDSKRGDIGNTAKLYAKAAFERMNADAVTLSPYLGADSVMPFLQYEGKFCFILVRTSNPASKEIQNLELKDGSMLFQSMAGMISKWASPDSAGFVVGATNPGEMEELRESFPDTLFLIPGIGSQGGDTERTIKSGTRKNDGLAVINVSRKIIFPGNGMTVRQAAEFYQNQLKLG